MKYICYVIAISALTSALSIDAHEKNNEKNHEKTEADQFTIKLESKWVDLEKNKKKKTFTDKWILAGDIIIRKTAADYVSLHELHLQWNGKKLDKLIASLYEKNNEKSFMPIEKNLICDSLWKKSEQKLILLFEKPKTLYSLNKLSLVLTVPPEVEEILKHGHFTIDIEYLPEVYKEYASENDLCLYLGDTNHTGIEK